MAKKDGILTALIVAGGVGLFMCYGIYQADKAENQPIIRRCPKCGITYEYYPNTYGDICPNIMNHKKK